MKRLHLLLLSFLIISCSTSRKVKINLETLDQSQQTQTQTSAVTQSASGSQTKVDISKMIDEFGLIIKGDGNQYSLNYGGLQFAGSADLELKKKKVVYQVINIYQNWNIYHHHNVTKTQEITKTNYKLKSKDIEAQQDSHWLYVLIFCAGMATMLLLIGLWKRCNPISFLKKMKEKLSNF